MTTINAAAARMLRLSEAQVAQSGGSMKLEQLIGADDRWFWIGCCDGRVVRDTRPSRRNSPARGRMKPDRFPWP